MPRTNYREKNYDIDLEYGEKGEDLICKIFEEDSKVEGSIEVKTERGQWKDTGNIAIEIAKKQGDKVIASCLNITDAKWWIHILKSDDLMHYSLIFPVKVLKRKINIMLSDGRAKKTWGGDDNNSRLVLLPLEEIHKL